MRRGAGVCERADGLRPFRSMWGLALIVALSWQGTCCVAAEPAIERKTSELVFLVPPFAKLFIQGQEQRRSSDAHRVISPPLEPGKAYLYSVKATWDEKGKPRTVERSVRVQAGQSRVVNLWGKSLREIVDEVVLESNRERVAAGSAPLKISKALEQAAQKHADNMARQKTLSHQLDNTDFVQRAEKEGYRFASGGENIAEGAFSSVDVVGMWMRSPGHKRNLLSLDFTEIGIGTAWDNQGRRFDAQVFGRPAVDPK